MAPIRFSDALVEKHPELFAYAQKKILFELVYRFIHSDGRLAVRLSDWIKDKVRSPTPFLVETAAKIKGSASYDQVVLNVFNYVRKNLTYKSDSLNWKMGEYWATPDETLLARTGDCEDGAILMYALCRLKGVPANRLLLWCGDVQSSPTAPLGGHCCLFYKPQNLPLAFVAIDWCYYPRIGWNRPLIEFYGDAIVEWSLDGVKEFSSYQKSWFFFNEETSFLKYNYRKKVTFL